MAIIDKKQTRWYSKSTFDSLDKTTIPVGTEIQVTGEIEETDLTADLQTKINGKLTAPATPNANSAVIMEANGTTGTKALSEFGGKLYKHEITIDVEQKHNYVFIFAYLNQDTIINTFDLLFENRDLLKGSTIIKMFQTPIENDMGILYDVANSYGIIGINVVLGAGGSTSFDLTAGYSMTDTVTEL